MTATTGPVVPLSNTTRFFIDGEWVKPSSDAVFDVIDSGTEQTYFQVPEAQPADMDLAIGAALQARASDYSAMWPRESGVVHAYAQASEAGSADTLRYYAGLADDYPFEEPYAPSATSLAGGGFGLLVREPVGVVGAIIPWNAPLPLILYKAA